MTFHIPREIRKINEEQFLLAMLSNKYGFEYLLKLEETFSQLQSFQKSFTFKKVSIPEYRCRLFVVPDFMIKGDTLSFIDHEVLKSENLEIVTYNNELYLLKDSTIMQVRFEGQYSPELNKLYNIYLKILGFIKNRTDLKRFAGYASILCKIQKLLTCKLNKYEIAGLQRLYLKSIYNVLILMGLRNVANSFRYYKIGEREFKELTIYEGNFIESFVRQKQYLIVTDNLQKIRINEIVNFMKEKTIDFVWNNYSEQPGKMIPKNVDRWLDQDFWQNGNTHFLGNIKYEFRKGTIAYENFNSDTQPIDADIFLSTEYFENRQLMNDIEIANLLDDNSISLRGKHVTSGRHRVFAMVGRLINGKQYIPFTVDRLK
mgnify:CR=1 FL=1